MLVTLIARLARCNGGATAVEYGLIASLIVVAVVSGIVAVGGATSKKWDHVANRVSAVEP